MSEACNRIDALMPSSAAYRVDFRVMIRDLETGAALYMVGRYSTQGLRHDRVLSRVARLSLSPTHWAWPSYVLVSSVAGAHHSGPMQADASKIHFLIKGLEPGNPLTHGQAFSLSSRRWSEWDVGMSRQPSSKLGGRELG